MCVCVCVCVCVCACVRACVRVCVCVPVTASATEQLLLAEIQSAHLLLSPAGSEIDSVLHSVQLCVFGEE